MSSRILYKISNLSKEQSATSTSGTGITRVRVEDLEIECGVTLFTGESGGGKSTLLGLIGFLDKGSSADGKKDWSIKFNPNIESSYTLSDLSGRSDFESMRRNHLGFVFQNDHLMDFLSCEENILLPMLSGIEPKVSRKELRERVLEKIHKLQFNDLENKLDTTPAELSGGQRQRMAFLRGILHEPDVLIADEPIASLDKRNSEKIINALHIMAAEDGKSLIVVIHDKDKDVFNGIDCNKFVVESGAVRRDSD
jgi:putative ABC transport system ATP-binding protein